MVGTYFADAAQRQHHDEGRHGEADDDRQQRAEQKEDEGARQDDRGEIPPGVVAW